jgi:hypothetical protein
MSSPRLACGPQIHSRAFAPRSAGVVTGAVGVAVLLAACTSSSGSGAKPPAAGSSHAAATSSAADPNAGLKTGTQLNAFLPTTKDLPKGFKLASDVTRNSADVFGPESTTALKKAACKKLDTSAWIDVAGLGSAAFAQTGFKDSYGNEIYANIDTFRGTEASKAMANIRKMLTLCATFKTTTPGVGKTTVKVSTKADPKAGDESLNATLTSPVWQQGSALVAVRTGKTVITVLYSSSKKDITTKAVKIAEGMAKKAAG